MSDTFTLNPEDSDEFFFINTTQPSFFLNDEAFSIIKLEKMTFDRSSEFTSLDLNISQIDWEALFQRRPLNLYQAESFHFNFPIEMQPIPIYSIQFVHEIPQFEEMFDNRNIAGSTQTSFNPSTSDQSPHHSDSDNLDLDFLSDRPLSINVPINATNEIANELSEETKTQDISKEPVSFVFKDSLNEEDKINISDKLTLNQRQEFQKDVQGEDIEPRSISDQLNKWSESS